MKSPLNGCVFLASLIMLKKPRQKKEIVRRNVLRVDRDAGTGAARAVAMKRATVDKSQSNEASPAESAARAIGIDRVSSHTDRGSRALRQMERALSRMGRDRR